MHGENVLNCWPHYKEIREMLLGSNSWVNLVLRILMMIYDEWFVHGEMY